MVPPGQKQIIQIAVTNRCDLFHCSNCTQMIPHQRDRYWMTPANFRLACESLADWTGIVGVFGGNPCVHQDFPELCAIMREVIPDIRRRGLWTNNLRGQGAVARETFGYFNLNVHDDEAAAAEMAAELPGVPIYGRGKQSWHAPVLLAVKDFVPDEQAMWSLIEQCDINLKWSGAITQHFGELRAYFCEVAAAFDNVYGEDRGLFVTPGWWKLPMEAFLEQARRWCPSCGVPLKRRGHLDRAFVDDMSVLHAALPVKRERVVHETLPVDGTDEVTDYLRLKGGR